MGPAAVDALAREVTRALQQGDFARAGGALGRLRSLAPQEPQVHHLEGLLRLAQGDALAARPHLELAAQALPGDAAVHANLGVCLQELALHARALVALQRSVELAPAHADGHYNLAVSLVALGRREDAIAALQRTLALQPAHAQAWTRLADSLHAARRIPAAIDAADVALRLRPAHAPSLALRSLLALERDEGETALLFAQRSCASDHEDYSGWYAQAAALHRLQRHDEAGRAADRALALKPQSPDALALRGLTHQAQHRLDEAAIDMLAATRLRFSPGGPKLPRSANAVSRAKLRHDLEQLAHLDALGLLSNAASLRDMHHRLLAALPVTLGDTGVLELEHSPLAGLAPAYNRLHHLAEAPRLADSALSPALDGAAIERDYRTRGPGITWIDGLLRTEALDALRRYCQESTFWFDCRHANGYLGAYFEQGFAAPLLLQIAEELRALAPAVFRDYPLIQMWAYKYDAALDGIEMHADVAAVNVNFWITPDEANLEPDHGGLLVWDRKAPPGWGLDEFNTSSLAGQARIRDFLAQEQAQCVVIPYRSNRAVVFHSDLFHRTDRVRFAPGYCNRRINVTMLFGRRQGRTR